MNTQHEHSFLSQLPHFADMTHVTHYRSPDPMPIPAVAPSQGSELRLWRRNVPAIVRRSDSCRNLANAIIAASKVRRSWFQRHPPAGQGRSHYHADQVHPSAHISGRRVAQTNLRPATTSGVAYSIGNWEPLSQFRAQVPQQGVFFPELANCLHLLLRKWFTL